MTISMQTTPWLPNWTQPVMIGVYQRKLRVGTVYSYWDGENWYGGMDTPRRAVTQCQRSAFLSAPWRGLLYPLDCGCVAHSTVGADAC